MKKLLLCLLGVIALVGCAEGSKEVEDTNELSSNEVLGVSSMLSATMDTSLIQEMSMKEEKEDLLEENLDLFNSYLSTFETLLSEDNSMVVNVVEGATYNEISYHYSLITTINLLNSEVYSYELYYNEVEIEEEIDDEFFGKGNAVSQLEGIAVLNGEVLNFTADKLSLQANNKMLNKVLEGIRFEAYTETSKIEINQAYSLTDQSYEKQLFDVKTYVNDEIVERTTFTINNDISNENEDSIKMVIYENDELQSIDVTKVYTENDYAFEVKYIQNGTILKCSVSIIENEDGTTSYEYTLNNQKITKERTFGKEVSDDTNVI